MLNLWELMTQAEQSHPLPAKRAQIQQMVRELSMKSPTGQEISIGVNEQGWLIKIHSCYTDSETVILIPQEIQLQVQIITDRRYHGQYAC
jgi:hypothetical protein